MLLFWSSMNTSFLSQILIDCLYEDQDDDNDVDQDGEQDLDHKERQQTNRSSRRTLVRHSYMEIADSSFFVGLSIVVRFCIFGTSLSIATLYLQTIRAILYDTLHETVPWLSRNGLLGLAVCPCLVFVFMSNLSKYAFLSLWALASLCLLIFTIGFYSVTEIDAWQFYHLKNFDTLKIVQAASIMVSGFSSQFFVVDIFKAMEFQHSFATVLNISYIISVLLFLAISIPAAHVFGRSLDEFVNLSIPSGYLKLIVNMAFLVKSVLSVPFTVYLSEVYLPPFPTFSVRNLDVRYWVSCIRRAMILFIAYVLTVVLPSYAVILQIIGGTVMVLAEIIFPACFHLKLKWNRLSCLEVTADGLVILFGIFVSTVTLSQVVLQCIG